MQWTIVLSLITFNHDAAVLDGLTIGKVQLMTATEPVIFQLNGTKLRGGQTLGQNVTVGANLITLPVNDPRHVVTLAVTAPVHVAGGVNRTYLRIDGVPGQSAVKGEGGDIQIFSPVRRALRDLCFAFNEGHGDAFETAVRRIFTVYRPVSRHRLLGVDDPVGYPTLRGFRDGGAVVKMSHISIETGNGLIQILLLLGRQKGMGIAENLQRLPLGGGIIGQSRHA
ncbi:hypothetical protein D3C81_745540 [compost metagenome]